MKYLSLLAVIFAVQAVHAFNIINKTGDVLYGAPYYYSARGAERMGDVKQLDPDNPVTLVAPRIVLRKDRVFVFSLREADLLPNLTTSAYHILPHVLVGIGGNMYLDFQEGSYKGFNEIEWKLVKPVKRTVAPLTKTIEDITFGSLREKFTQALHPLSSQGATVRRSVDLPQEEHEYQQMRIARAKWALSAIIPQAASPRTPTPVIGVAGSGGGYRAMLGFLGFLEGLEESVLLDAVTYISTVSGSTWLLAPWISSGWSLKEFRERLLPKIQTNLASGMPDITKVAQEIVKRFAFKQKVTAIDIYGILLGNKLLNDFPSGPYGQYLYDQSMRLNDGSYPFPIYTAVATKLPYQWVEFTPYEVGGNYFGGYIPSWSFGAPFVHGKMLFPTPPYGLGFMMAMWGSAFSARLHEVVGRIAPALPKPLRNIAISAMSEDLTIRNHRLSAAEIYNWTWGMQPLPRSEQEFMKLVDAGMAYNIALDPLFRRKSDIIIIANYSTPHDRDLRIATEDLVAKGYSLPPINYDDLGSKKWWVFKDPDNLQVPMIIYFPNSGVPLSCETSWCDSPQLSYPREKSLELIESTRNTMMEAAPDIIREIAWWIEAHSQKS